MEWAQVLAIVVPVMLTIVIGVIYNNKRIDDLRLDMNRCFGELKADTNRRFDEFKADTNRRFAEVHDDLKEIKTDIRELKSDTDRRFEELKADIREIRQFLMRLIPLPEPPKENPK